MERLTIPDKPIEGGIRRAVIDTRAVKEEAMKVYWALKKYEDTGLTPEQIREMDQLYLDKCREVTELKKRLEWVPVGERLPEPGDGWAHVLISMDDGFVATTDYTADDGFGLWVESGEVLAWRPRPEPYRPEVNKPVKRGRCDVL